MLITKLSHADLGTKKNLSAALYPVNVVRAWAQRISGVRLVTHHWNRLSTSILRYRGLLAIDLHEHDKIDIFLEHPM